MKIVCAGVAERFRRLAADSLHVGSNPIPGSTEQTAARNRWNFADAFR